MIEDDTDNEGGWLRRNLVTVVTGGIVLGIGGVILYIALTQNASAPTIKPIQQVTLIKPDLPPPPPPKIEPPKPQEQQVEPEPQLEEPKPLDQPKDLPPLPDMNGPLGLDVQGEGAGDAFGLVGQPGGRAFIGGGGGGGGTARQRWMAYGNVIEPRLAEALQAHEKTKYADIRSILIRLWATPDGHVSKIELVKPTGDLELDAAIEKSVFVGLSLGDPPPADLPFPIRIRISGRGSKPS